MTAHVSAAARTSLRTVATTRSATGSTRRSISPASMRKSGRMRRQHTWSISRCSATATTRTPPASAISTAVRLIELAVLPRSQGSRVQNIDFLALRLGYPNIVPPTVQVSTRYPGASAQTVIDTIALPIVGAGRFHVDHAGDAVDLQL